MANFIGSILEIENDKAVIMTSSCEFVKVKKKPGMFVGQQIYFDQKDIYLKKNNYVKYYALVASFALLIFSYGMFSRVYMPNTVYAYFDVDINPSIELTVDKSMKVLEVKPLNDDAKALLEDLDLIKLPIKQAITEIVRDSKEEGYIKDDLENAILISASIDQEKSKDVEEKTLDDILAEIKQMASGLEGGKIETEVLKVTPEKRSEAIQNGLSMGRYMLYNELKQEMKNLTIEEAKESRVADMINKTLEKSIEKTNKEEIKNEVKVKNQDIKSVEEKPAADVKDKAKEEKIKEDKTSKEKEKVDNKNNVKRKEERKSPSSEDLPSVKNKDESPQSENKNIKDIVEKKEDNVHNKNSYLNESDNLTSPKENGEVKSINTDSGNSESAKSKDKIDNSNSNSNDNSKDKSKDNSKDTKQSTDKNDQNSKK